MSSVFSSLKPLSPIPRSRGDPVDVGVGGGEKGYKGGLGPVTPRFSPDRYDGSSWEGTRR